MSEFVRERVQMGETAATIAAPRTHIGSAVRAMLQARAQIQKVVLRDPGFLTALEPYTCVPNAGAVVERMCEAARTASVGPMAAVAGTIAQAGLEAMVAEGCRHGWVDNGGDLCLLLGEHVTLEILPDPSSDIALGVELEPTDGTLGICSSSGRFGHSISLGDSDIALAMADSAPLADALATAIGNRVRNSNSLRSCFRPFEKLGGFRAGLVIRDGVAAMYGDLPRIVQVEHDPSKVTSHSSMSSSRFLGSHYADRRVIV